jgi:hypothetical protein
MTAMSALAGMSFQNKWIRWTLDDNSAEDAEAGGDPELSGMFESGLLRLE